MTEIFPIRFSILGLSIFGILFMKITWFQGLLILSRNQLSDKLNESGVIVSTEISKKMNSGLSFHLPKKGMSLNDDYHIHNFDEATIADVFSSNDISQKIKIAMERYGLVNVKYEYAVADKKGNIGWQAVGIIPIRKNFSGYVPIPGDGRYEWKI